MTSIDQLPIELITSEDQIVRCRLLPTACADCGRMDDELRTITINYAQRPYTHRRERCDRCRQWLNHATGAYDLTVHEFNKQMEAKMRNRDK